MLSVLCTDGLCDVSGHFRGPAASMCGDNASNSNRAADIIAGIGWHYYSPCIRLFLPLLPPPSGTPIALSITIDRTTRRARFDFTGTGPEVFGNTNAPRAVAYSAILYCLRCLVDQDVPLNQGCLAPIDIVIPPGCLLHPSPTAAVVGGNVLTSQRVVDVVLKVRRHFRALRVFLLLT